MTVTSTPAATSRKGRARTIRAGDDRESPLKYTRISYVAAPALAGDDRESPLKYTQRCALCSRPKAGDDRESPLKYTRSNSNEISFALGMTENRRSSTLNTPVASVTYRLGMTENRRSSTLIHSDGLGGCRWG